MRHGHRFPAWLGGAAGMLAVAVMLPLATPSAGVAAPAALTVVGIVIPERGPSLAAIEDRATARTQLYRVGDAVSGGVVTAIAPDRVTVVFDGQATLMRLAIYVGDAPGRGAAADRPTGDRPGSRAGGAAFTHDPEADVPRGPYGQLGAVTPSPGGPSVAGVGSGSAGGSTGGGGTTGGSGGTGGSASAATLTFTGMLHNGRQQEGAEFSGQSLRDLLITVNQSNASGSSQRVELLTPDGSVYQQYTGAALPASQLRVPIGGTWITEHGLFGAWTVQVYFGRAQTPALTGGFVLSR